MDQTSSLMTDDQYHAIFDALPGELRTVPRYHMESLGALKLALLSSWPYVQRKHKPGAMVPTGHYTMHLLDGTECRIFCKSGRLLTITVKRGLDYEVTKRKGT